MFFAPIANRPFMAVDLTVSNLLRASPTRSSKQLESFFQLRVCLFLPFPALLPLSRFNAANIVFPHLQTSIALVCRVISLGRFWIIITKNVRCDWLLCWGSANEKMCCSHCCGVQKNCTRLLSRALAAGVVCIQRGGVGSTHRFG